MFRYKLYRTTLHLIVLFVFFNYITDGKTVLTYFGSRNCLTIWPELQCDFRQIIVNIVPSDFTGQSRLDLLVTVKNENAKKNEQLFRIFLASGGPEDKKCDQRKQLLENALSEPFVLGKATIAKHIFH